MTKVRHIDGENLKYLKIINSNMILHPIFMCFEFVFNVYFELGDDGELLRSMSSKELEFEIS